MAERSWCPSLRTQLDKGSPVEHSITPAADLKSATGDGQKAAARSGAAVAAHSDASAKAISGSLAATFQRRFQKFDAAVVGSNANRLYWPSTTSVAALQFHSPLVPSGFAVGVDVEQLQTMQLHAPLFATPADNLIDLLALLARRDALSLCDAGAPQFTGLVCLPSVSHVTSLSSTLDSLLRSKAFLAHLQHLTVCDASVGDDQSALTSFARSAPKLETLALVSCALGSDVSSFLEVVKESELRSLKLERSNIGCSPADADREAVLTSLAALLKTSKFLTSLDLSHTNLDAEALTSVVNGLVESDTRMSPQEMEDKPDAFDPSTWPERLSAAKFKALVAGKTTGEMDGDEEDGDAQDAAQDEDAASESASAMGDDEDPGEAEEEDEEEDEDEEAPAKGKDAAAVKEKKRREREQLRAQQRQQQQHQRQVTQLVQLESRERVALIENYIDGMRGIVASSSAAIAHRYAEEKQKAKEVYCARRSGWSHLAALVLRGNPIGDVGAAQLALVLREEVPLSDEEARQRQEVADTMRGSLVAALGAARAAVTTEEAKAWELLMHAAENEFAEVSAAQPGGAHAYEEEEEDEYAKEAPPVVLTNVENRRGSGADEIAATNGDDGAEQSPEERRQWEDWAADGVPQIVVAPVKNGMRSITLLDLGSCRIGRKGLQALAEVLKTNTVLQSLCLRHNPLGRATAKSSSANSTVVAQISTSFAKFVETLRVNHALQTLDLGYCQLGPEHVRAVASALADNATLLTLGLEGNQLGVDEEYQQNLTAHSYLYDLFAVAAEPHCSLRHLHLSHNPLALCLWPEEATTLAAACSRLCTLSLSHAGLQQSHLQLWTEALQYEAETQQPSIRILQLARNEFAGEADGAALGALLQHFAVLEELSLDEHPQLGSAGVAAALEHVPTTLRRLSCGGTGLKEPCVGAVQAPVVPPTVTQHLTTLILADVEAPSVELLHAWTTHLASAAKCIQFLSLWSRGMAGKESDVVTSFVELAEACPSLLYVDCGFQPQAQSQLPSQEKPFLRLERLLLPRRMSRSA